MQAKLYMRLSIALILMLAIQFGVALKAAADNWFAPGDVGYPLQRAGELALTLFQGGQQERVDWLISLVERRCQALARRPDASLLDDVDQALDRAAAAYARLSSGGFEKEALRSAAALCELAYEQNPTLKTAPTARILESKLHSLRLVLTNASSRPEDLLNIIDLLQKTQVALSVAQPASALVATVDPRLVTFPGGSQGALHTFYPLTGKHTGLGCNLCHPAGNYAGTPGLCLDCHLEDAPPDHYSLNCASCHSTAGWEQIAFDHREVAGRSCESCHQAERPAQHYPGPCTACHTPTAWKQVNFDHAVAGATDCIACHTSKKPADHYGGQCSACHSTSAWKPATFNHAATGATDCIACHTKNKPANHYGGQCSQCHVTNTWAFNHSTSGLTDCLACHTSNKPANHYGGQCSACHTTSAWMPATFNHAAAGATDCIACHTVNKPANHYDGQCSTCHTTSSWSGASFPHTFPTSHEGANNQCAKCHPVSTAQWTCYVCHDQAKMEEKHLEKNITNLASRCLECHPTGNKE